MNVITRPFLPSDRPQLEGSRAAILPWKFRMEAYAAKHNRGDAINWGIANGAPSEAIRLVRAPISAIATTDAGYNSAATAFLDSATPGSAFLRMLSAGAFHRVPFHARSMVTTTPGTAVQVSEGAAKPMSDLQVTTVVLSVVKALAWSWFTNETLFDVGADGQRYFHAQLVAAVAKAIDSTFLDLITHTGTPSNATAGPTAANAWTDLRTALLATNASGAGNLYWIAGPAVANRAATLDAAGIPVFTAAPNALANYPLLVTDGCPAGELYLIDANNLVANSDTIALRESKQADAVMSSTPSMSSTVPTAAAGLTSAWQNNSTIFLAECYFGAQTLHDTAVHVTTGINWGG